MLERRFDLILDMLSFELLRTYLAYHVLVSKVKERMMRGRAWLSQVKLGYSFHPTPLINLQ